jgi:hypothetical protein
MSACTAPALFHFVTMGLVLDAQLVYAERPMESNRSASEPATIFDSEHPLAAFGAIR